MVTAKMVTIIAAAAPKASRDGVERFGHGFYRGDLGKGNGWQFCAIATSNLAHENAKTAPRRAFSRDAIFTIAQSLVGKPIWVGHRDGAIAKIVRSAVIHQPRCHYSHITDSLCGDVNARQTAVDGFLTVIVQVSAPMLASMDLSALGCSVGFDFKDFEAAKTNSGQYALIHASGASEVSLVAIPAVPGSGIVNSEIGGELLRSYGAIFTAPSDRSARNFAGLVMSA